MKKIFLLAALASVVMFTACENNTPYDTQTADDAPLILKPYNESGTGSFTYQLANPDTPLLDSVTVTPSKYTTVNWYLNKQLVYTGVKINMCFPAGTYDLTIEAVTTAGKSTHRDGKLTVKPYDNDPYSAAPAAGRHYLPATTVSLDGQNLTKAAKVVLSKDPFGREAVCDAIDPASQADGNLTFVLPELTAGRYFIRLVDAEGNVYGADAFYVYTRPVVLAGYKEFTPGEKITLTGLSLQNVVSAKLGADLISEVTATATSVCFTAPAVGEGSYALSLTNADGSAVDFQTGTEIVQEVQTKASFETTIWTGPVVLDWNADLVKVTKEEMADIPAGSTIYVYYDVPEAEYHALRITTPWWGTPATLETDLVLQFDVKDETPNPFSFEYDARCKGLVDERGAMSIVGFGETINKITYK